MGGETFIYKLLRFLTAIMQLNKHWPLICRGGCSFCLDTKGTKKSRQKKASTREAIRPARFSVSPTRFCSVNLIAVQSLATI
jgi:hypothetical protein